ncbi:hypothetical protein MJI52_19515, partial [Salmonella enterica subsp. enterica serovar Montevideo]|nr:hypothetical protein [Salmonella enterica subsp. enterica serovar Montevideo]
INLEKYADDAKFRLMLLTAPKLNRMTQDDDTAEKGSKAATV